MNFCISNKASNYSNSEHAYLVKDDRRIEITNSLEIAPTNEYSWPSEIVENFIPVTIGSVPYCKPIADYIFTIF